MQKVKTLIDSIPAVFIRFLFKLNRYYPPKQNKQRIKSNILKKVAGT